MAQLVSALVEHVQLLLFSLPLARSCIHYSPRSPELSPQEGELEGLLGESWRDDESDALSLHLRTNFPVQTSKYPERKGLRANDRSRSNRLAYQSDDDEPGQDQLTTEFDEDPTNLDRHTLDKLPELAKRYEPTLTLEDIAKEEALQAEVESKASRTNGSTRYPLSTGDDDGDFGQFHEAGGEEVPTGELGLNAHPDTRADNEDETAEVSFGLVEPEGRDSEDEWAD